jgi:hypothetical protein
MNERRTFDTPVRSRWNAPIHNCLKAVDAHTELYLLHGDPWHLERAAMLRDYLHQLKTWIHAEEAKSMASMEQGSGTQGRTE